MKKVVLLTLMVVGINAYGAADTRPQTPSYNERVKTLIAKIQRNITDPKQKETLQENLDSHPQDPYNRAAACYFCSSVPENYKKQLGDLMDEKSNF